jgi:hypothetical protein
VKVAKPKSVAAPKPKPKAVVVVKPQLPAHAVRSADHRLAAAGAATVARGTAVGAVTSLATSVREPSRVWKLLAVLFFALPALVLLATLVPVNFRFVPYSISDAWDERRREIAASSLLLLVADVLIYLLLLG